MEKRRPNFMVLIFTTIFVFVLASASNPEVRILCHINRTVTVDIASNVSGWNHMYVKSGSNKDECRSDLITKRISFNIDKECNLEPILTPQGAIFEILVIIERRESNFAVDELNFAKNCVDTRYSDQDRKTAPALGDGQFFIEPHSDSALATQTTTVLIVVVAIALAVLVLIIVAIVCVTCDCFGTCCGRGQYKRRTKRNRKPRDALTRY